MKPKEIAEVILRFINDDSVDELEWDDFISVKETDQRMESVRLSCAAIRDEYPPADPRDYCSEEGLDELRKIAEGLLQKEV